MNTGQVTATTSATLIVAANSSRKKLTLKNTGSITVYIGSNSSVLTTTGFPILAGETMDASDLLTNVYAICASTSTIMYIDEVI
jgi:hypothetical protein